MEESKQNKSMKEIYKKKRNESRECNSNISRRTGAGVGLQAIGEVERAVEEAHAAGVAPHRDATAAAQQVTRPAISACSAAAADATAGAFSSRQWYMPAALSRLQVGLEPHPGCGATSRPLQAVRRCAAARYAAAANPLSSWVDLRARER
ncbi:unnamed protein product [Urochloa humidicola]